MILSRSRQSPGIGSQYSHCASGSIRSRSASKSPLRNASKPSRITAALSVLMARVSRRRRVTSYPPPRRFRDTLGTRFSPDPPNLALRRWAGEDSNLRLTDYESAALTAELPARGLPLQQIDVPEPNLSRSTAVAFDRHAAPQTARG